MTAHVVIYITNRPTTTTADKDLIVAYDSICPCEIYIDGKLKYKSVNKTKTQTSQIADGTYWLWWKRVVGIRVRTQAFIDRW
jgi:hypothetical protein